MSDRVGAHLPARDNPLHPQTAAGHGHAFREHRCLLALFFWSVLPATSLSGLLLSEAEYKAANNWSCPVYFIILHTYSSNHLCGIAWFMPLFHNSFSCAGECFSIVVGVKARSWLQNLLRSAFLYIEKHMSSLWMPHKTLKAKFLGVLTDLWEVFNTVLGTWEKLNWSLFQWSCTNKTYLHLNCVQQGLGSLQQEYPTPSDNLVFPLVS